jgi:hypothetical protein
MKKYFLYSILVLSAFFHTAVAQNYVSTDCETMTEEREALQHLNAPKIAAGDKVFYICNDMGRNGYYEQKQIGRLMGNMASLTGLDFVAAIGDIHHFYGVASVDDPLWMTNFELIYAHPELMLPWYPVLGNHEYRGNTQAVINYSTKSRRWMMPSRYYSKTVTIGKTKALLLFIDTTPLIDKYRNDAETYPDACKQSREDELNWIENQLKNSDAKWKIVMGHHPVFAQTDKSIDERDQMQKYLKPLLDRYNVDVYVCGHIHNFQHIQPKDSKTLFIVNSSASLARKVKPTDGTVFCSSEAGFLIADLNDKALSFYMINGNGETIHEIKIDK